MVPVDSLESGSQMLANGENFGEQMINCCDFLFGACVGLVDFAKCCRMSSYLQNSGFDTAENEPFKVGYKGLTLDN